MKRFLALSLCVPVLVASACSKSKGDASTSPSAGSAKNSQAKQSALKAASVDGQPSEGRTEPEPASSITPESLLPAGTFLYFEAESLDTVDRLMRELGRSVGGPAGALPGVRDLLAMTLPGLDVHKLDGKRAVALSMSMSEVGAEPARTFYLPASDAAGLARSIRGQLALARGGYLVISEMTAYAPSSSAGAAFADLPDATFAGRIDFATLVDRLGPMLDVVYAGLEGSMSQDVPAYVTDADAYRAGHDFGIELVKSCIKSTDRLDMAFDVDGSELDARVSASFRAGSVLSALGSGTPLDIGSVLACVDPNAMMVFAGGFDEHLTKTVLEPFVTGLARSAPGLVPYDEAQLHELFARYHELFGAACAASYELGAGKTRIACVYSSKKAQEAVASFGQWFAPAPFEQAGLQLAGPVASEIGGVSVSTWSLEPVAIGSGALIVHESQGPSPDEFRTACRTLFGSPTVSLRLASKGDKVLLGVGGDEAWFGQGLARLDATQASELAADFAPIAGSNPGFAARIDMARLMAEMEGLVAQMMAAQMGKPVGARPASFERSPTASVPMVLWMGAQDERCHFGWRGDLAQLAQLAQQAH
jgi:hypothetical protein